VVFSTWQPLSSGLHPVRDEFHELRLVGIHYGSLRTQFIRAEGPDRVAVTVRVTWTIEGSIDVKLSSTGAVKVAVANGTVNVIGDVVGYYTNTTLKELADSTGPAGPAANVVWAKVDGDSASANLIGGSGVSSVSRVNPGQYLVTFTSSIVGCGWFATRGDNAYGVAQQGEIAVEQNSSGDPNTLRVRTFNSAGVGADTSPSDGFNVQIICP
jgi:hypothetical protein